jgi:hypothetical protein
MEILISCNKQLIINLKSNNYENFNGPSGSEGKKG